MLILEGPNYAVDAITFSPDSTTLYVVQGHQGIRAWNITDGTATRVERDGKLLIEQFTFDPTGRWVVSATAHTTPTDQMRGRLIDMAKGVSHRLNIDSGRGNIAFLGGERLVSIGHSSYDLARPSPDVSRWRYYGWSTTPGGPVYEWHCDFPPNENPRFIASLGERFAVTEHLSSRVPGTSHLEWTVRLAIRQASDSGLVMELPNPPKQVQELLAAPDGSLIVARNGTELHFWATDGTAPRRIPGGYQSFLQRASTLRLPPSGRYFLFANFDTAP